MKVLRLAGILLAMLCAAAFSMSAQAAREGNPEAKDLVLKGDAKCTGCHDESDEPLPSMLELHPSVLAIAKTRHGVRADGRTPTCTDCHGESDKHLNYKGKDKPPKPDRYFTKNTATPVEARNEACLACHKGGLRSHWEGSQHASRDVACTSCHGIHVQQDKVLSKATQSEVCFACHKTERAQTHRISTHPLDAGKMSCSDCHNPHGSFGPKLLVKNSVNETCYTCHAEKRGPFLWEHSPVVDDCTNCHTPHGSTNTPLLKARAPFLCSECHSGDHGKNIYSGGNLPSGNITNVNGMLPAGSQSPPAQLNSRSCMNCHSLVHGSNHPAGAKFQR
jgi:DmsE family decaheme c-type cytochrome